jgi:hypothetical protein
MRKVMCITFLCASLPKPNGFIRGCLRVSPHCLASLDPVRFSTANKNNNREVPGSQMNTKNPFHTESRAGTGKNQGRATNSSVLRFAYEAEDGIRSSHEISNWDETRVYVRGYSTITGELQTFRKDRILEVFSKHKPLGLTFNRSLK